MPLAAPLQSHVAQTESAFITHATSAALNWREVLVEHVVLRSGELYVPRLNDHLICMVLDRDYGLEQSRNGQTFRHTFQPGQAQVLPMETSGWWRSEKDVHLLHLQFSQDFIHNVAAQTTSYDPAQVELHDHFLIEDAQLQHLGLTLLRELEEGGSSGRLFSGALATAIATRQRRAFPCSPAAGARLHPRPSGGRHLRRVAGRAASSERQPFQRGLQGQRRRCPLSVCADAARRTGAAASCGGRSLPGAGGRRCWLL
jgi:hypothetical protein